MSLEPNPEITLPTESKPQTWLVYQDEDGGDLWVLDSKGIWNMVDLFGGTVLHHDETWESIVLNYGPIRIVDHVYADHEINNLSAFNYN